MRREEDRRRVGEGAAEEHGGAAAIDKEDPAVEIEGDGGAEGLVAEEQHLRVGRDCVLLFEREDAGGEVLRRKDGREAREGEVRGE